MGINGLDTSDYNTLSSVGKYTESFGVADLRYESSFVVFLKPRPKLTFGCDAQLAFIP
jgi:hypothetical protein